jgi:hypothetical protein
LSGPSLAWCWLAQLLASWSHLHRLLVTPSHHSGGLVWAAAVAAQRMLCPSALPSWESGMFAMLMAIVAKAFPSELAALLWLSFALAIV